MKKNDGYTLIEVIVAVALISMIMIMLTYATTQSVNNITNAKIYKKESDEAFDMIQSDKTDNAYDTSYEIVTTDSNNRQNRINVRLESYQDKTSKNQLLYQSVDNKLGINFDYSFAYTDSKGKYQAGKIDELENYGVQSFEDLPDTNYSALQKISDEWGDWSFIGWSTDTKTYTYNGRSVINGNPQIASASNNWKGLITKENFNQIKDAINKRQINDLHLYATYMYSFDIPDNDADVECIKATPEPVRQAQDNKNLNKLATQAATILKNKGTSAVDNCVSGDVREAIYGDGLELLHFRENGWPVEANKYYHNKRNDWTWAERAYSDPLRIKINPNFIEKAVYYINYPKIASQQAYSKGFVKNDGFFYETFKDGVGFDLTQIGNPTSLWEADKKDVFRNLEFNGSGRWRGINYDYRCLLFGQSFMGDSNQFNYSLFMKINRVNKTVTVWVNTVSNDGQSNSNGLNASYSATASYA